MENPPNLREFAGFTHEFLLGGGNSIFFLFMFISTTWGFMIQFDERAYFSDGLEKPTNFRHDLGFTHLIGFQNRFLLMEIWGCHIPMFMVSHRKLLTVFSVFQNPPVIPCEDWFFGTPTRSSLSRCLSKHLLHSAGICKTRIRGAFHHLLVP